MKETFSNELRFRAKVNDHVPPYELLAWADKIEAMEKVLNYADKYAHGEKDIYLTVLQQLTARAISIVQKQKT